MSLCFTFIYSISHGLFPCRDASFYFISLLPRELSLIFLKRAFSSILVCFLVLWWDTDQNQPGEESVHFILYAQVTVPHGGRSVGAGLQGRSLEVGSKANSTDNTAHQLVDRFSSCSEFDAAQNHPPSDGAIHSGQEPPHQAVIKTISHRHGYRAIWSAQSHSETLSNDWTMLNLQQ